MAGPLFLPEIEQYADSDPILYEILQRLASAQASSPILSGNGDPTGAVQATPNSLYIQTDPTSGATGMFVNTDGTTNGWQSLSTILTPSTPAQTAQSPVSPAALIFMTPKKLILGRNSAQFDNQGRIASSFFNQPVDVTGLPLTQMLTQHGVTTQIDIAAHTWQLPEFTMASNSGSVDPGVFGTFNVFFDDVQYRGGVEIFQFVPVSGINNADAIKKRGRFFCGQITTAGGGGGAGVGGGTGGSGGGRYFN